MMKKFISIFAVLIFTAVFLAVTSPCPASASPDWWDISYQYRRQITVSTGINSPYNGYAGYSVEFTMNTTSPEIQDDGDDLRIVWWNGTGWQELDRHIYDPNTASTIIRFSLQTDIVASSNEDNYYVYYGNAAAGAGPANLENVYLHYNNHSIDRFTEYYIGRLGITNWHGSGDYSPPFDGANQRISYNTGDNFAGEWVVLDVNERDVYLEYQMRDSGIYPTNTTPGLLARIQWATPGSSINDFYTASYTQGSYNEAGIGRNARNSITSAYDPVGTKYYSNNTAYRFYFAVWGVNATSFKADFASDSGYLQWKPEATPYVNGSSTEASELESAGPVGFLVAQQIGWMDEFMVRRYVEPEPILSLAAEESVTSPTVTTNDTSDIGIDTARLNGTLDDLGSATSANVSFEWGVTPGGPYPNETTPETLNVTGSFNFDLSSLTQSTTYYFRAKAAGHGTGYGVERSFTTLTSPTVTTSDATNIGIDTAQLHGNLDDLGTAASANVSFEWGMVPGGPYPNETTPETVNVTGSFSFDLSSLTQSTTYYFRAKASGHATGYGVEKSFTTLTSPTVTTSDASAIDINSARLNGTLDDLGTATSANISFEWGVTPGGPYPNETTPETLNVTGTFCFNLSSLNQSTTYYFRAKVIGDSTSYGTEKSFTTNTYVEYVDGPQMHFLHFNIPGLEKRFSIDATGKLLETIDCSDGTLNIYISKGTAVLDKYGKPLRALEVSVAESPPGLSGGIYQLGPAYTLLPGGTTFDPPMTITWSYDPDSLPDEVHEEELYLAYYDESMGRWIRLGGLVDTLNNTVTAEVSHCSTFALLGRESKPASFTVYNLMISPTMVSAGESITVGVSVANTGDFIGSHDITLKIDDVVVDNKVITIPDGTSQTVTFELSKDTVGSYSVDVNGLSGSFVVEAAESKTSQQTASPERSNIPELSLTQTMPASRDYSWLLISSITVAIILGLALYFLVIRPRMA